jgi:quercetin dioxygenase-like cupin family protein
MDEKKLAFALKQEGFGHTYVWQDAPNTSYPIHTHATETAHIILEGEMTLTIGAESRTYKSGRALQRARWCHALRANGTQRLPLHCRRALSIN